MCASISISPKFSAGISLYLSTYQSIYLIISLLIYINLERLIFILNYKFEYLCFSLFSPVSPASLRFLLLSPSILVSSCILSLISLSLSIYIYIYIYTPSRNLKRNSDLYINRYRTWKKHLIFSEESKKLETYVCKNQINNSW